MSELVIDFKNDGVVEALHMDGFDLGFLGDKKVVRQTDIIFNESSQKWDMVYLSKSSAGYYDTNLMGFDTYEDARKTEVRWINDCRLHGIDPVSKEGIEAMRSLRRIETGLTCLDRIAVGYPIGEVIVMVAWHGHSAPKPEGPANDVVKTLLGCEYHKSVFDPS